jgi:hypothetical protein
MSDLDFCSDLPGATFVFWLVHAYILTKSMVHSPIRTLAAQGDGRIGVHCAGSSSSGSRGAKPLANGAGQPKPPSSKPSVTGQATTSSKSGWIAAEPGTEP